MSSAKEQDHENPLLSLLGLPDETPALEKLTNPIARRILAPRAIDLMPQRRVQSRQVCVDEITGYRPTTAGQESNTTNEVAYRRSSVLRIRRRARPTALKIPDFFKADERVELAETEERQIWRIARALRFQRLQRILGRRRRRQSCR